MTFAQRLRTVKVSEENFETAERHNYYDKDALPWDTETAYEKMLDDTDGIGFAQTDPKTGEVYHKDRKTGEVKALDDKQLDVLLGSRTEREYDGRLEA